ncbi:hypothetical protein L6R29_04535 [Myxococcota bacterium]|nr:hypothetical protein [Myxococcota bacterium]
MFTTSSLLPTMPRPKPPKKRLRAQRGAAIIIVISLLLVLTLIGTNMLQTSSFNYQVTMSQMRIQQASQIAKSAIHATANHFSIHGNDLLNRMLACPASCSSDADCPADRCGDFTKCDTTGTKTCILTSGTSLDACTQPRTLCLNAQTLMPRASHPTEKRLTGAFALDSFREFDKLYDFTSTGGDALPNVRPDFEVRVFNPVKSQFIAPVAGNSLEQHNICTYTVTAVATGRLVSWEFRQDLLANGQLSGTQEWKPMSLAERTYRAYLHLSATGDEFCK